MYGSIGCDLSGLWIKSVYLNWGSMPCRNGTKDSLFRFLLNSAQAPLDAAKCGHALRSARRWQALVRRAGAPFLLQLPLRCATICITGRNDGIGRRDGLKIRW